LLSGSVHQIPLLSLAFINLKLAHMKRSSIARPVISFLLVCIILCSCKKDTEVTNDTATTKFKWITTGTWKQKDLVLAYPIDFAGSSLPVGFSLYNITGYLPVSGPLIDCTKDNTYTFNSDSSYAINGCTDLMLAGAGSAGKWRLEIHNAVLRLTAADNTSNPYWTNKLTETEWSLGMTLYIAEADASLPVNLILEKQ